MQERKQDLSSTGDQGAYGPRQSNASEIHCEVQYLFRATFNPSIDFSQHKRIKNMHALLSLINWIQSNTCYGPGNAYGNIS